MNLNIQMVLIFPSRVGYSVRKGREGRGYIDLGPASIKSLYILDGKP